MGRLKRCYLVSPNESVNEKSDENSVQLKEHDKSEVSPCVLDY